MNILGLFGLNDSVIAKARPPRPEPGLTMYERYPLRGYVEGYRSNAKIEEGGVKV